MTYYFSFQVLGVDKSASQRDIQKAFHKFVLLTSYVNEIQLLRSFCFDSYAFLKKLCRLSLKYHPDKNKSKGAQEKFAEINNGNLLTCLSLQFFNDEILVLIFLV